MVGSMKKPVTLITGAGVRIGAQIARHLAARGHDLVLHYHHSQNEAEALADELRANHAAQVTLVQADLEAYDGEAFWHGLPPVDHLIHNAGRFLRDQLDGMQPRALRSHLAVNLEAPLLLSQHYLAQLPEGTKGCILVLGDGNKRWSMSPEFFSYAVSKLAWESVIDLLAAAAAPRARANLIALAPTLVGEAETDAMYDRLKDRAPLKRNSSAAEVCAAVEFLLTSEGITGQIISLASGFGLATHRPLFDSKPYFADT